MNAEKVQKISQALKLWRMLSPKPLGKWLFGKIICFKAPYFNSIAPQFKVLEPGLCLVMIKKRRLVHNHINTVHAIAMCNMAELAGGTMMEVSVPISQRWIPKGMTVRYIKKAETNLTAEARFANVPTYGEAQSMQVNVKVTDVANELVFEASIEMWVAPKKAAL
jgi:acyl-coenzyme A thioesterase PaaI-like protein